MEPSFVPLAEHLALQSQFQRLQLAYLAQQRELNQLQEGAVRAELERVQSQIKQLSEVPA